GTYTLTAGAPGFRRQILANVDVKAEGSTDLGNVRLDIAGCDAPGVICDPVGPPEPDHAYARGEHFIDAKCGVDLDSGRRLCRGEGDVDLVVRLDANGQVFVRPANGAQVGELVGLGNC